MDIAFPVELQRRFEQAVVACPADAAPDRPGSGAHLERGRVVTAADLALRFEAPAEDVKQVLAAAYRKGLVDETGADGFRILGMQDTTFVSVFTHTARSGLNPRSWVRAVEVEPAGAEVAAKLEVDPGSPVYRYVRTRYVSDEPLANQVNYMPFEVCPGLEDDDVTRYSFQKLLEEKYHTVLAGAREAISLVPATPQDRQVLGLPGEGRVLVIDRVALSPTGRPVVWATIRIRTDRYAYVEALWPEAAALLQEE